MPTKRIKYPPHNDMTIEEYCHIALQELKVETSLLYVPAYWSTYYTRADYGYNKTVVDRIEMHLNRIKQKWFTISQYDDGIFLNREKPSNCISFSAGGKGDIAIPLTSYRWPGINANAEKTILCSFIGNMNTHEIRKDMYNALSKESGYKIEQIFIHQPHYSKVMNESRYALCPRGYGPTSFRLYEAMGMGTIPIYISDVHWLPFEKYLDWSKFCIIIKPEDIKRIPEIIDSITIEKEKEMSVECLRVWNEYFCYESCAKMIKKILEELK